MNERTRSTAISLSKLNESVRFLHSFDDKLSVVCCQDDAGEQFDGSEQNDFE